MKKLLAIVTLMMVCICASAQKVVTVEDASNMSAKELKQAAKEAKARDKIVAANLKAKAAVEKGEKKVQELTDKYIKIIG